MKDIANTRQADMESQEGKPVLIKWFPSAVKRMTKQLQYMLENVEEIYKIVHMAKAKDDGELLRTAVNLQTAVNRLVWKLNRDAGIGPKEEGDGNG